MLTSDASVVLDASVVVSVACREPSSAAVLGELSAYAGAGAKIYAPYSVASEVLYVICRQKHAGILDDRNRSLALAQIGRIFEAISVPPVTDLGLALRAAELGTGYSCRRTTDALYIALSEVLSQTSSVALFTLDVEMSKLASRLLPNATVRLF